MGRDFSQAEHHLYIGTPWGGLMAVLPRSFT